MHRFQKTRIFLELGISIRKSEVKAGAYRLLEEDDPILGN